MEKKLFLGWRRVDKMIVSLAKKIREDFNPDVIVGVARGGLIPAVKLSHLLGEKEFKTVHVRYYMGRQHTKKPVLVADVGKVRGKVLVVDDVADTGESLALVISRLKKKGAREVRSATLAYKPHSTTKPDYYVMETDRWIVFPWEQQQCSLRLHRSVRQLLLLVSLQVLQRI